jgi:hypothetical protein
MKVVLRGEIMNICIDLILLEGYCMFQNLYSFKYFFMLYCIKNNVLFTNNNFYSNSLSIFSIKYLQFKLNLSHESGFKRWNYEYLHRSYFTWRVLYVYRQVYITQLLTNGAQKLLYHPRWLWHYICVLHK